MDANPFYCLILTAVARLPAGRVASYAQVATQAGLPGRARMVGRVLREQDDANLPWHRVLRADGHLAFAKGSRNYGEQVRRLRAEGVVIRNGKVPRIAFVAMASHDLDATLWGESRPLSASETLDEHR